MTKQTWLAILIFAATGHVRADVDQSVVSKIEADFASRRDRPHSVEYAASGKITYPAGGLTNPDDKASAPQVRAFFPLENVIFDIKVRFLVDARTVRVTRDDSEMLLNASLGEFVHRNERQSYNGSSTYQKYSKSQGSMPDPTYSKGDQIIKHDGFALGFVTLEDCPLLFAHGYVGNSNPAGLNSKQLAYFSARHWQNVGNGSVSGDSCVVLRSVTSPTKYEEMWVDLSKASAVRRWKLVQKDKVVCQFDVSYSKTGPYWLPQSWKYDDLEGRGSISHRSTREMVVDSVRTDFPVKDSDFEIQLETGMLVIDPNNIANDMVVDSGGQLVRRPASRSFGWLFWSILMIVVILSLFAIYRFRRRSVVGNKN